MPRSENHPAIERYLSTVREQIRCKRARTWAADELADHIADQRQDYLDAGEPEETATEKALLEMGDPVEIGTQLDRVHRPVPAWDVVLLMGVLTVLGVALQIIVDISGPAEGSGIAGAVMQGVITLGLALGVYAMDYSRVFKRPALPFQILAVFFLLVLLLPRMPFSIPDFLSSFLYGVYSIAPEIMTVSFAGVLFACRDKGLTGYWLCIGHMVIFGLLLSGDWKTSMPWAFIFLGICLLELGAAVWKGWYGIHKAWLLCPVAVLLAVFLLEFDHYRWTFQRFFWQLQTSALPADDRYSWHLANMREILGNTRFFGSAEGESLTVFLEQNHNHGFDLLSATGILGAAVPVGIAVLLGVFLYFLWRRALRVKMSLGYMLAIVCVSLLTLQTVHFFVFNFGFQLFSTRGLPLLLNGNASVLPSGILTGLLLSVFYNQNIVREPAFPLKKLGKRNMAVEK